MKVIVSFALVTILFTSSIAQSPKGVRVAGRVIGVDGKSTPGLKVLLIHLNTLQTWSMETDQNGRYEFFVRAGQSIPEYEILGTPGSSCSFRAEKRFTLEPKKNEYTVDLKLKSQGRCLID